MTPSAPEVYPQDDAKILDRYWDSYLDILPLWQKIPREKRTDLLHRPVLPHPKGSNYAGADMELNPEILGSFPKFDVPRQRGMALRLTRLFQIAARIGSISPENADEDQIERVVRQLVLLPAAHRELATDSLHPETYWYGSSLSDKPLNFSRLHSLSRLQRFLAVEPGAGTKWEREEGIPSRSDSLNLFSGTYVLALAQQIARHLMETLTPLPAEKIAETLRLTEKQAGFLPKALRGLLQWGFVVMDTDLDSIRIGLWPSLSRKIQANSTPPELPPILDEPADRAPWIAYLIADMEVVLTTALADPIPLKKGTDLSLYKSALENLVQRLPEMASWYSPDLKTSRINEALHHLLNLRLSARIYSPPRIRGTSEGSLWIKKNLTKRVKFILDTLLKSGSTAYVPGLDRVVIPEDRQDLKSRIVSHPAKKRKELAEAILDGWRSCPQDQWIPLSAWLQFLNKTRNPIALASAGTSGLVLCKSRTAFGSHVFVKVDAEALEELSLSMVSDFFSSILFPLGCVDLGRTEENVICFRLNAVGRYFLQLTQEFPEIEEPALGKVVLQPNFEIVFLGPNASAEAALEPLCERLGHGTGTIFRLSKPQVQNWVDSGKSLESILQSLEEITAKPVPENIRKEMATWSQSIRNFTVEILTVLRCSDAQAAIRLRAELGSTASLLTPTLVQIDTPLSGAQRRKLAAKGFFQGYQ
jgi:hypothetical protein